MNRIYDMLQSEKAVDRLVLTLATAISERAPGGRARKWVTQKVVRDLFTHLVKHAGSFERHHPTDSFERQRQEGAAGLPRRPASGSALVESATSLDDPGLRPYP